MNNIQLTCIQWTGKNKKEVEDFVGHEVHTFANDDNLQLHLNYQLDVPQGNYIIRGFDGNFYSCSKSKLPYNTREI